MSIFFPRWAQYLHVGGPRRPNNILRMSLYLKLKAFSYLHFKHTNILCTSDELSRPNFFLGFYSCVKKCNLTLAIEPYQSKQ